MIRWDRSFMPARLSSLHDRDSYAEHAVAHSVEGTRGGVRKIDDPVGDLRTAIVDAHLDRPSVAQVGDEHPRTERQRAVRRRERVHVERLATRRLSPLV